VKRRGQVWQDASVQRRSRRDGSVLVVQSWRRDPLWRRCLAAELYQVRRGLLEGAGDETRTRDILPGSGRRASETKSRTRGAGAPRPPPRVPLDRVRRAGRSRASPGGDQHGRSGARRLTPELTAERIAEALARAEKVACRPGDDRCYPLPYSAQEAQKTCTPKGRCKVGWIVSRGGREGWHVWLEVRTGLVKLIRQTDP
jgi:hypothetical protein